ncbi:unnamed protein product [Durusdinium trenchii]|uniref:Uncharacterized protein n=2 Tax=Durusdinium trenchii TaxID=1381693 RepID=A0ABP0S9T0_9DINO
MSQETPESELERPEALAPSTTPEEKVDSKKTSGKNGSASKAITVGQLPYVRKHAGAPKLEPPRARRMSGAGSTGDPFDGDNLDDILKSLISTKKVDAAYQQLGKRILALESYVEVLRGGAGEEAFITRKEFIEYLQKSQEDTEAQLQAEREAREAAEEARRLEAELAAQKEDPILIEMREGLKAQDEKTDSALKQAMHDARKADVAKWTRMNQLEEMIQGVRLELGIETQKRQSAEARAEDAVLEVQKSLKDLELRMQVFAMEEAQKMIGALIFNGKSNGVQLQQPVGPLQVGVQSRPSSSPTVGPAITTSMTATSGDVEEEAMVAMDLLLDRRKKAFQTACQGATGAYSGPEDWRSAMLALVDLGLLQPVREQVQSIQQDLLRQRDLIEKKNRAREKDIAEANAKGQKTAQQLREECDTRKQEAVENSIQFQKVYKVILESNEKFTDDMQYATDRIRTLQMLIDGHTKQIDGHTKGILECATNEDAARLTDAIQQCVGKESFSGQMSDLKAIVAQQSERIGSIDLQVGMLTRNTSLSPSGSKRSLKRMTKLKTMRRDASKSSLAASTAPGQDSLPSFFGETEGVDDDDDEDGGPGSNGKLSKSNGGSRVSLAAGDFEEELYDDESEYSEDPMEEQMREQVQGICMGLVCLAHHILRGPPQVGLSRQNRLLNEKELLDELLNLRHWITHRRAPADWSLDRLTTVALRYSHPNPMEVHGPQPEMTSILHQTREAQADRGRSYPLDVSVGSIGIPGGFGSSAGGGAGIMGGPLEDTTLLPSPASKIPGLEGSAVAPPKTSRSGQGWRSHSLSAKVPMSARELRGHMASTLPPLH